MQSLASNRAWLIANRDLCVEALRIYLGFALFVKGASFLYGSTGAVEYFKHLVGLPFLPYFIVHVVGLAHICGGLLLCIGLITRFAALIQIPILFGAILFVHWPAGLFATDQSIEFTMLVLFLLVFFLIYGSGRISADFMLAKKRRVVDE